MLKKSDKASVTLRLLSCVLGLLVPLGGAQATGILEVYELARVNDPRYKAAEYEFKASEYIVDQARAGFFPTVRLDLEKTRTEQDISRSDNPVFNTGTTRFSTDNHTLSVVQPLYRKDVIERLAQAKAIVRQAHFTLLAAQQDLLMRVSTAYLSVLAANDGLELARAERVAVRRQLDLAESRLKAGLGAITNLYDATARFAVDQAREIEAENKLADTKQALREITGQNVTELRRVRDPFPMVGPVPASPDPWVAAARTQNYLLLARAEGVIVASQEIERQRAGYYPSLNALGNRNYRDSGSTLFGGGSTTTTTDVTLRFSWPIFEGFLTKAQTAEARARYDKALQDQETDYRAVERQTRSSFQSVLSGMGLVNALSQAVAAQEKTLESKEIGARNGLFTVLNVLDAQRDLFLARRDYAQVRYEYLINRLKLKQNAGTLSPDDLLEIEKVLEARAVLLQRQSPAAPFVPGYQPATPQSLREQAKPETRSLYTTEGSVPRAVVTPERAVDRAQGRP